MSAITRQQREALKRVHERTKGFDKPSTLTYRQFRRTAQVNYLLGCVMVPYGSMWLGIEQDGYTHS